jgi:hypothetical protein
MLLLALLCKSNKISLVEIGSGLPVNWTFKLKVLLHVEVFKGEATVMFVGGGLGL